VHRAAASYPVNAVRLSGNSPKLTGAERETKPSLTSLSRGKVSYSRVCYSSIGRKSLGARARKAEEFPWKRNERKEVYVLYSRSGFAFEPEENVLLFSLGIVERDFKREETLVAEL